MEKRRVVVLDRSDPEFDTKKVELKKLGYKWDRWEKVWRAPVGRKQTEANDSQKPAPLAQAGWFGDATEIQLSKDDPDFESKKKLLKSTGFRWDSQAKVWRLPG